MESVDEEQAKRCFTEFSGVWAYTPYYEYGKSKGAKKAVLDLLKTA